MTELSPEVAYCRAVTKSWEKLRILYNVLLLIPGAALLWKTILIQEEFGSDLELPVDFYLIAHPLMLILAAVVFGMGANIFYCLGPYVEFLITARGFPLNAGKARYFLFGLGVTLSFGIIALVWISVSTGILFTLAVVE